MILPAIGASGNYGLEGQGIFRNGSGIVFNSLNNNHKPSAYVVIHLLDKDENVLATQEKFVSQGAGVYHHISTEVEVVDRAVKYAVVYVANESPTDVYFDDLELKHERLVWQENSYYPFGLAIKPLDKEGSPNHRFTYNGKELEEETGFLDYHARQHDPQLGRFMSVDPLAERFYPFSPFAYVINNPMNMIDPDGKSGVIVIDMEKETVSFESHIYFYGGEATEELKDKALKEINDTWNNNLTVSFNGKDVPLNVKVTGEVVSTEKAKELAANNKSTKNNFVAIETAATTLKYQKTINPKLTVASSFFSDNGNSGIFTKEDILAGSKSVAHEWGHGFGWYNSAQAGKAGLASAKGTHDLAGTRARGKGGQEFSIPNLMVARYTHKNDPSRFLHPSLPSFGDDYVDKRGYIIPSKRIATQRDVKYLNINFNRMTVGSMNNKIYDIN